MSEQLNEGNEQQEPDTGTAPEQKEKVTFSEEQQAVIDKVAVEGRENVRTERQKSADLQRRLDEAQAKVPKETRPNVPDATDIYDDDYETSRIARESQIREQAKFDAKQEFTAEQTQQTQVAEQQAKQTAFNESLVKFNGSAVNFGIDPAALQQMDSTIASHGGLRYDVGTRVLSDEQGMLIYQHFSQHPDDIYKINQMGEGDAAVFIHEIRTKAVALNVKRSSNAPDPAENLSGSGVPPDKRGPGGATYE